MCDVTRASTGCGSCRPEVEAIVTLACRGLEKAIVQKKVTYDLARQMSGATEVKTAQFGDAIIENMGAR